MDPSPCPGSQDCCSRPSNRLPAAFAASRA